MVLIYRYQKLISNCCFLVMIGVPILIYLNKPEILLKRQTKLRPAARPFESSKNSNMLKKSLKTVAPAALSNDILKAIPPLEDMKAIGKLLYKEKKRIAIQVGVHPIIQIIDIMSSWYTIDAISIIYQGYTSDLKRGRNNDDALKTTLKLLHNFKGKSCISCQPRMLIIHLDRCHQAMQRRRRHVPQTNP